MTHLLDTSPPGYAIPPAAADAAAGAVHEVARRLADVDHVAEVASAETNRDPVVGELQWHPGTLSHGYPGTATLFGTLNAAEGGWEQVAHAHITAAANSLGMTPAQGTASGPAALLAATMSRPDAYGTLRSRFTEWVATTQMQEIGSARQRIAAGGRGVSWSEYDVITGTSGVGRLLLDAAMFDDHTDLVHAAIEQTCTHLTALATPAETPRGRSVGWWVPAEEQPVEQDRIAYPEGDVNLGLAHGITGPLAFLAEAHRRGFTVAAQTDAIRTFADWLIGWQLEDPAGAYPCRVTLAQEMDRPAGDPHITRSAWCYGAAGVGLALAAAGAALEDSRITQAAADSLVAAIDLDPALQRLDGPTICHGTAGLLLCAHEVARMTGSEEVAARVPALVTDVLRAFAADAPFCFQHTAPDSPEGWRAAAGTRSMDVAGVLEGAAGVALVLHEVVGGGSAERRQPYWGGVLMCPM